MRNDKLVWGTEPIYFAKQLLSKNQRLVQDQVNPVFGDTTSRQNLCV